jgi:hypothetical protein
MKEKVDGLGFCLQIEEHSSGKPGPPWRLDPAFRRGWRRVVFGQLPYATAGFVETGAPGASGRWSAILTPGSRFLLFTEYIRSPVLHMTAARLTPPFSSRSSLRSQQRRLAPGAALGVHHLHGWNIEARGTRLEEPGSRDQARGTWVESLHNCTLSHFAGTGTGVEARRKLLVCPG